LAGKREASIQHACKRILGLACPSREPARLKARWWVQFEINTASLTDEVWSLEELVALLEVNATEAAA
jgi:hypothetical protein